MFSANTYRIRLANAADADAIDGWAAPPLTGSVLVGEIDGRAAAAMSLSDGQTATDGSAGTDHLLANMRMRALSMVAHAAVPSLRDRTLAAVPVWYRTVTTGVSGADTADERELASV
jgi:hypothetical protein